MNKSIRLRVISPWTYFVLQTRIIIIESKEEILMLSNKKRREMQMSVLKL